eukprot:COSAG01_NODE_12_length_41732_cov_160.472964_11_plen_218_part_00
MSSRLAYFSESPNAQQQRRRQQRGKVGSEGTQRGRRFSMPNNLHDIQPLVVGRVGAREGRAKRGAVADLDGHEGLLSDLDLDALAEEVSPAGTGTGGCAPSTSSNGTIAIPPGQVLHGGPPPPPPQQQQQEPERGSSGSEEDEEEQRGGDTLGYLTSSSSSAAVQRGSRTARAVAGGGHRMGGAGAAVATVGGGGGLEGGGADQERDPEKIRGRVAL